MNHVMTAPSCRPCLACGAAPDEGVLAGRGSLSAAPQGTPPDRANRSLSARGRRRQHRLRRHAARLTIAVAFAVLLPISTGLFGGSSPAHADGAGIAGGARPSTAAREIIRPNGRAGIDPFRAALRHGDLARADSLARDALARARTRIARSQAHARLCVVSRLQGRLSAARRQCDAAVALAPRDWRWRVNRAAVAIEQGDFDLARTDLRRADRLSHGEAVIAANRRILEMRRKAAGRRQGRIAHGLAARRPRR